MDVRFVVIIIMGILLLLWVMGVSIKFMGYMKTYANRLHIPVRVKCEKCQTLYETSVAEANVSWFSKSRSITRTKMQGAAFVNEPSFQYYAKKINCPHCRKREYGQILNIAEIQGELRGPLLTAGLRYLAIMLIGGVLIMGIMQVPMHLANQAAQEKVEQLRQQRYEDFKETYGLDK